MDSNAIKEIANQLGVGAGYLLNHLSEFAPKWAAMQAAKSGIACVFLAVALTVAVYVFVKALNTYKSDDISYSEESEAFALILIFGIAAFCVFIAIALFSSNLAMHIASPEAAMLNDMLQAVQK